MTRYVDTHRIGLAALAVCEQVRHEDPDEVFANLVRRCAAEPEQVTQIAMCLAIWVDYDGPIAALIERAEAIATGRPQAVS